MVTGSAQQHRAQIDIDPRGFFRCMCQCWLGMWVKGGYI